MEELIIDNYSIKIPLISIVKDIKLQIHNGNLKDIREQGENIRVTCPHHNHGLEKSPDCDIYIGDTIYLPNGNIKVAYGTVKCFACDFKGPFHHFVAECFDKSDEWAKEWLKTNYGEPIGENDFEIIDIDNKKSNIKYIDEGILNTYQSYHPYMDKRKLSPEIIKMFSIKYDPKSQSIVFPVWDTKNRLVMLTSRNVNTKFFHIPPKVEKPIYLLNYIRANNISEVMITEGQIDALTAFGYGMPCVATMGAISESQISSLNNSGIRILYTMFDNDDAGKKFANMIAQKISQDIFVINVPILFKNKKDINDLSKDEFWQCLNMAKSYL